MKSHRALWPGGRQESTDIRDYHDDFRFQISHTYYKTFKCFTQKASPRTPSKKLHLMYHRIKSARCGSSHCPRKLGPSTQSKPPSGYVWDVPANLPTYKSYSSRHFVGSCVSEQENKTTIARQKRKNVVRETQRVKKSI